MKNKEYIYIGGFIGLILIGIFYMNLNKEESQVVNTFSVAIKETAEKMSQNYDLNSLIDLIKEKYPYEIGLNPDTDFGSCLWLCKSVEMCSSTEVIICNKNSPSYEQMEVTYKLSMVTTEQYLGKTYYVDNNYRVLYEESLPYTIFFNKNLISEVHNSQI